MKTRVLQPTRGMDVHALLCGLVLIMVIALPTRAQILAPKRGFADTGGSYSYLRATNANWYHTWGGGLGSPGNHDALHIPMFRSWTNISSRINWILTRPQPTEWVMGFNEPERSDQDNLSVSEAISRWTQIANGLAGSGIGLISPAVSDNGTGQSWLSSFMSQADSLGLQVDAVAFHWYGVSNPNDPIGAANSFIGRVDWYHNTFSRPVWITEFAIHDWGGNYSDEAMRNANEIFLGNVIPRLESRSYVLGYAWYHWFGDASLVEGNPLGPTNVGMKYVGVLNSGDTFDFGGVDLGEYTAYLNGGDLACTSAGGSIRYITALGGTSNISGNADWELNAGDWLRIQPGATLRKTGSSLVTCSDMDITNDGSLDIAGGELHLYDAPILGSGSMRVAGGGTLSFDASRATHANLTYDVELAGGTIATPLLNGISVTGGKSLSGNGHIASRLFIQPSALVRVGEPGLPPIPSQFVIDDLEGYATGPVRDAASPPWTAHQDTSFAAVQDDGSGNHMMAFGWDSEYRGASRALSGHTGIPDGTVATFFLRFMSLTDSPDHNIGLGDRVTTNGVSFNDFEAQIRCYADDYATPGTFGLDARNGGTFVGLLDALTINTWYNLWLVIDQSNDTFDVYLNTGTADATAGNKLNASPLAFRNGTSDPLDVFLALAGPAPVSYGVRVDDLAMLSGTDLTNPLGGLNPTESYDPGMLTVDGDVTAYIGGTLELGIASPSVLDQISTAGQFSAGGTLSVVLDSATPLPAAGDAFDLIDAASFSGAFDALDLPALPAGFFWNTGDLYSSGAMSVVSIDQFVSCMMGPDVPPAIDCEVNDLDSDGDVDVQDYAKLQDLMDAAS